MAIFSPRWDRCLQQCPEDKVNVKSRKLVKVQMKCFFFIAEFERAAKIRFTVS